MHAEQILERKGSDVATIPPDATVTDALAVLREHDIGALVVSPDGQTVAGILSERDIVRRLGTDGADALASPVSDLMKTDVSTCVRSASTDELMAQMTEGRFRHIPVVDDDGRLAGIVSIGDVVKARIDELAHEREQLTDYIRSSSG